MHEYYEAKNTKTGSLPTHEKEKIYWGITKKPNHSLYKGNRNLMRTKGEILDAEEMCKSQYTWTRNTASETKNSTLTGNLLLMDDGKVEIFEHDSKKP